MRYSLIIVFFACISTCGNPVEAQDTLSRRPKVGLVLSGGGAKGLAHIGVLKVLEEAGIKVDYIAGTSMGSLVGALYAIGYNASQIDDIARNMDWNDMMSDEVSRRNISIEEKDQDGKYAAQFPFKNGKVSLPKGLISGNKISAMLSYLTWSVHTVNDFNKLPIPFRCIATDITTVQPVVLNKGFLPDALRASMAIPSYFTPMEIDGRLLVDGGVVRNFPVQDVKEMGADIVIGVDVTAGLLQRDEIRSVFAIMDQASTYSIALSNAMQRKMCNIIIEPEIDNFNAFSYSSADSIIKLGEIAASKQFERLKRLADSLNRWPDYDRKAVNPRSRTFIPVNRIVIEGLDKVADHVVLSNLDIKEGDSVDQRKLRFGVERVYGTQFFESVSYKIVPDSVSNTLVIMVKEQTLSYFKFGFNYTNQFKSAILLNATFRNLLGEGSRLLADIRLSENPAFKIHYSIHTRWKPNIGFSTKLTYNIYDANYYDEAGAKITQFNYRNLVAETELQSALSNPLLLGAGITYRDQVLKAQYAPYDSMGIHLNSWRAYFRAQFDSYDRTVFPRSGRRLNLRFSKYFEGSENPGSTAWNHHFWEGYIIFDRIYPLHPQVSLTTSLSAGFVYDKHIHPLDQFYLGGDNRFDTKIIPFPGLPFMGVRSPGYWLMKGGLQFEAWPDKFFYFSFGAANPQIDRHDLLKGGTVIYGVETGAGFKSIIGPVYITIGSNTRTNSLDTKINVGFVF
jgi:NTE family protein